MKKTILLTAMLFLCLISKAQEGHKINAGFDLSFGLYYFGNSEKNNPNTITVNLGYEHNFSEYLGVEVGVKGGQFYQSLSYYDPNIAPPTTGSGIENNALTKNVYKGDIWAPYIAPKLYYPLGDENKDGRSKYLYLENKFSYTSAKLKLDEIEGLQGSKTKRQVEYEIRLGFAYPISTNWLMNCWLGYNTFDFGRIAPDVIKFKNATPVQIGLGFGYVL